VVVDGRRRDRAEKLFALLGSGLPVLFFLLFLVPSSDEGVFAFFRGFPVRFSELEAQAGNVTFSFYN
jgi:hypothetical protein